MAELTPKEYFLFQSHALVECLANLGSMEIKKDSDFETLKSKIYGQSAKIIKQSDSNTPIFQGQGVLLAVFYLLLVVPHEMTKKEELPKYDMKKAEEVAKATMKNVENTYLIEKPILAHIRNAMSHARLDWAEGRLSITDVQGKKQKFYAEFTMEGLGAIAQELNIAFATYVETELKKR